jgi:hypothetical protein
MTLGVRVRTLQIDLDPQSFPSPHDELRIGGRRVAIAADGSLGLEVCPAPTHGDDNEGEGSMVSGASGGLKSVAEDGQQQQPKMRGARSVTSSARSGRSGAVRNMVVPPKVGSRPPPKPTPEEQAEAAVAAAAAAAAAAATPAAPAEKQRISTSGCDLM